ncbi:MAG: hypothetical protein AB8B85_05480 [Paracoccaceae bacterium]
MAVQTTDYISVNRGGTPADGSSGTYYVDTIANVLALIVEVSADAGNIITAGTDGGAFMNQAVIQANETTTTLAYNAGTTTLTFTDEDGAATNIDLSALTTDIYVTGASIAAGVITFSDNDGGTPDFTLDISGFINALTDNQAGGTLTLTTAGGANTVVQKTAWMSAAVAP